MPIILLPLKFNDVLLMLYIYPSIILTHELMLPYQLLMYWLYHFKIISLLSLNFLKYKHHIFLSIFKFLILILQSMILNHLIVMIINQQINTSQISSLILIQIASIYFNNTLAVLIIQHYLYLFIQVLNIYVSINLIQSLTYLFLFYS